MARKPRPVDPSDGPIPAFAHALRTVREKAGNPTYRALATVAGFSATTLSDAAGGVRQPSLEVTLAYVGACGGDVADWERRWRELDRRLAQERTTTTTAAPIATTTGTTTAAPTAAPTGHDPARGETDPTGETSEATPATAAGEPVAPAAPEVTELQPSTDGVSAGPGMLPPWARWAVAAAAALAVVVASGLFAVRTATAGRTAQPAATGPTCPAAGSPSTRSASAAATPGSFSGTTYNVNTLIRAGASLGAPVVLQAPSGCSLRFTGFCLGDVVVDVTGGSPDMRWFMVSQGGVVSSAVIHGNPPSTMQPSSCPDSVPAPTAVSLSVARQPDDSGTVELRAAGQHVAIVGFAAYFAPVGGSPQSPKWQQLGLTGEAATGFSVPWRVGPLRAGMPADATVPVVAAACLGGGGPTTVVDARLVPLGSPGAGQPASSDPASPTATSPGTTSPDPAGLAKAELGDTDLLKAEQAACRYPQRG